MVEGIAGLDYKNSIKRINALRVKYVVILNGKVNVRLRGRLKGKYSHWQGVSPTVLHPQSPVDIRQSVNTVLMKMFYEKTSVM
jgi:hypothetical protein